MPSFNDNIPVNSSLRLFKPSEVATTTLNKADEKLFLDDIKIFYQATLQFELEVDEALAKMVTQRNVINLFNNWTREIIQTEKDFIGRINKAIKEIQLACVNGELNIAGLTAQLKTVTKTYFEFVRCDQSLLKFNAPAFGSYLIELHELANDTIFTATMQKISVLVRDDSQRLISVGVDEKHKRRLG